MKKDISVYELNRIQRYMMQMRPVLKKDALFSDGTSDYRKDCFVVGDYKKLPNEVGGMGTALPEEVADKIKALLTEYNGKEEKTLRIFWISM